MRRFTSIIAVIAALSLTDSHWLAMQALSWVAMSQESDQSLIEIMSGSLTCERCCAISDAKQQEGERTHDLLSQGRVLAPVQFQQVTLPQRAESILFWAVRDEYCRSQWVSGVPVPPPWSA